MIAAGLVETAWVYTIVAASAAFVAIVGAFFTSKILGISAGRNQLENELTLTQAEVKERQRIGGQYRASMDETLYGWAEEDMSDFLENQARGELTSVPTTDDLMMEFKKSRGEDADRFQKKALASLYDKFKPKLEEAVGRRKIEEAMKQSPLSQVYSAVMGFRGITDFGFLGRIKLPDQVNREVQQFRELSNKWEVEKNAVAVGQTRIGELTRQIKSIAGPKYVRLGFFSLIYFAIVGIGVPLGLVLAGVQFAYPVDVLTFVLFLSGFAVTFGYLGLEIRYATAETRRLPP